MASPASPASPSTPLKMPKRKREDSDERSGRTAHRGGHQAIDGKIHYGKQVLFRALKLGKAFERQKLSRRQKTAQKDSDRSAMNRILDEIEAIKTLDLHELSEVHIHKTILKQKSLRESPLLPQYVKDKAQMQMSQPTANIAARLFKSAPVARAMNDVMESVRAALKAEYPRICRLTADTESVKEKYLVKDMSSAEEEEGGDQGSDQDETHAQDHANHAISMDKITRGTIRSGDGSADDSDEESLGLSDRLADSSHEASTDLDALRSRQKPTRDMSVSLSPSPQPSADPDDLDAVGLAASDDSGLCSEDEEDRPSRPAAPSRLPTAQPGSSEFLQSLSLTGYYSGGSDSEEAEDIAEEFEAKRKNRRGQRARQAIWEKKYGEGAKHVQKAKDAPGRDEGWDLKRGATANGSRGGRGKGFQKRGNVNLRPLGGGRGFQTRDSKEKLQKPRSKNDDVANKPLHPSWEAARKAKEKNSQNGPVAFAGTKVVFD